MLDYDCPNVDRHKQGGDRHIIDSTTVSDVSVLKASCSTELAVSVVGFMY